MPINTSLTPLQGVVVIEPRVYSDERGSFFESFNQRDIDAALGGALRFVQDNQSLSVMHVVRGLHYQLHQPQGKLVRVLAGAIFDVAVDLRRESPTFGQWFGLELSAGNKRQLWIPVGFAHGFSVIEGPAEVLYKTTDYWKAGDERTICWDDPTLAIRWPLAGAPVVSKKDREGLAFAKAPTFPAGPA